MNALQFMCRECHKIRNNGDMEQYGEPPHIKNGIRTVPLCMPGGLPDHDWKQELHQDAYICNRCGIGRTGWEIEQATIRSIGQSDFDRDSEVGVERNLGPNNWPSFDRDSEIKPPLGFDRGEWRAMEDEIKQTGLGSIIDGPEKKWTKVIEDPDCPPNQMFFIKKGEVMDVTWDYLMKQYKEMNRPNARARLLDEAREAVLKDRNLDYGDPEDNFKDIADMCNIMFDGVDEFLPRHAALMGIIIKMSRLKTSPHKMDHWVDVAGYAACGWECIEGEAGFRSDRDADDDTGSEADVTE